MARSKGTLAISANFEPQVAAPFDGRGRVEFYADLLLDATWQAKNGNVYTYPGMVVTVWGDTDKNGIYILEGDYHYEQNWRQGSNTTEFVASGINYVGDYVAETPYSKGDLVAITAGDGSSYGYVSRIDNNTSDPLTTPASWMKFFIKGSKGDTGANGIAVNGTNGLTPFIGQNGNWWIGTQDTSVKAEGKTPYIGVNGNWYIGTLDTGARAAGRDGESSVANINYKGDWAIGTPYYNQNPNANGKTDVVVGSDGNSYYAKQNSTGVDPTTDTDKSHWTLFVMKGPQGEDGTPGRNVQFQKSATHIQWRYIGDETWVDLLPLTDIKGEGNISDVSLPIGAVIMWTGSATEIPTGFALCNGQTSNGIETPDLRAKFVVGYDNSKTDYNAIGKTGGLEKVKLLSSESGVPAHVHPVDYVEDATGDYRRGIPDGDNNVVSANNTTTIKANTSADAQFAHENRPPFYVVAFIMKVSYTADYTGKTAYDVYLQVTTDNPVMDKLQWLESLRGETGIAGVNYRFDYDNAATYMDNDAVRSLVDGNAYLCKVDNTIGKEPSANPTEWGIFVMKGAQGESGKKVLLQKNGTNLEWKHDEVGAIWQVLLPLTDITGKRVELQKSATHIQWRYEGDATWTNLVALSELAGETPTSVITSDIPVFFSDSNRYLGKYKSGTTIPSTGWTTEQLIKDIAMEFVKATASLSTSTSIAFNAASASIVLNYGYLLKTAGSVLKSLSLQYRRANTGSWIEIANSGTSFTHNVLTSSGTNNSDTYNYQVIVVETYAGTDYTTTALLTVTPAVYSAPTLGASDNQTKEFGAIAYSQSKTVTKGSANTTFTGYQLFYELNGGARTAVGSFVNNTTMSNVAIAVTSAGAINGTTVAGLPTASRYKLFMRVTDSYTSNDLPILDYQFTYNRYFGAVASIPTGADSTARRTSVTSYNPTAQAIQAGSFVMATGNTQKIFFVCLPQGLQLLSALDTTANATVSFSAAQDYVMKDAGITDRTFKMYTVTLGQAFSSSHNWTITIGLV